MLSCVFCYDRDVWGETEWSGGSWDMAVTVLQSEVSRNTISCSNSHFPPACLSLSLINPNTNYLHNLHYSNSEHRQHHTPHTTRHHTSLQDETPSVYVLHIKIDIYVDICVNSLQWRCLYMFWLMFLWEIINIFFVLVKKSPGGREEPRDTKITDKTQGSMLAMKQKTFAALARSRSLSLSLSPNAIEPQVVHRHSLDKNLVKNLKFTGWYRIVGYQDF